MTDEYARGIKAAAEVCRELDECGLPDGDTYEHVVLALLDEISPASLCDDADLTDEDRIAYWKDAYERMAARNKELSVRQASQMAPGDTVELANEILNCIEVSIPFLDLEPVSDSDIDYGETADRIIAIIEREKAKAIEAMPSPPPIPAEEG